MSAAQDFTADFIEEPSASPSASPEAKSKADKASPMVAQFLAVKAKHPDELLFFRMGDFYELFFEDAKIASRALDIALTARGLYQGEPIPMCGVPVHSHTGYLARLIRQGHRVAICEQTETPEEAKKRSGKTLVNRDVIRIITPGTLTEDTLLDARAHNYLLTVVADGREDLALAWCDLSTGIFEVECAPRASFAATLARLSPREVLVADTLANQDGIAQVVREAGASLTIRPSSLFDAANCRTRLLGFYKVASSDVWGGLSLSETTAAGALLDYITLTQVGAVPALQAPVRVLRGGLLEIDAASRRNLEIMETVGGAKQGSLLSTIDRTITAGGARLLATRLSAPLTDVEAISMRQDAVAWAIERTECAQNIRDRLKACPDMERALSRLALDRGGPRDLAAVREALRVAEGIYADLGDVSALPVVLEQAARALVGHGALIDLLQRALADELPLLARDGGFISRTFSPTLDQFLTMRDDSRRLIAALQMRYIEETGLSGLKIKHNNIIGFHIELPSQQAEKLMALPRAAEFIHRQTMAGAMRFATKELVDLERDISQAAERALALELELFRDLRAAVLAKQGELALLASALAEFDVTIALADLALSENWCRPLVDNSTDFCIEKGRHPVVEAALKAQAAAPFIANDCNLATTQRLWLLTGPNMAGKSTFLRQNALIVVLAQMGSFVPAARAKLGVVDRLFSRVGASDDLARGRSTFMVEMVETATILTLATPRSLVILDEIGRGTATHDGLAIAWACAEHLHNINRCRALFATHYHELRALTASLPALSCHSMRVREWKGDIVFLHEVAKGAADRSYGLHVARLAGLPAPVIRRAKEILQQLESAGMGSVPSELPLFAALSASEPQEESGEDAPAPDALRMYLASINPDALSPREALDVLYRLKEKEQEKVTPQLPR